MDDLDMGASCMSHLFKIWTDKWESKGEVKCGDVVLRHKLFIVTSNFSIDEVFGPPLPDTTLEAIKRRCHVHHVFNREGLEQIQFNI